MARQAIEVPNYIINSLIPCRGGAEHRAGNSRRDRPRSSLGKMRHHLAREQQHRRLGLGAADHAEIDLQRRALEAADATVITLDGAANLLRRTDPSQAFLDLRFERLPRQALDHFLVVGTVARGHAGHPTRGRVDDRLEILVERLAASGWMSGVSS